MDITNNVVYNLTRALYGTHPAPIGGDFAFSTDAASTYITENVWNTDVARYGIDIWMTTRQSSGDLNFSARLGVKIHDAKTLRKVLAPCFVRLLAPYSP